MIVAIVRKFARFYVAFFAFQPLFTNRHSGGTTNRSLVSGR